MAAESTSDCNRRQTVVKTRGRTLTSPRFRRGDIFSPQNWQGRRTRSGRGTDCWPSTHRVCLCVIWTVWGLWTLRERGFRDVVLFLMELLDKSSRTEAASLKVHQPSVTKQVWLHHKPKNRTVCGHRLCWILGLHNPDWVYPAADKSPPELLGTDLATSKHLALWLTLVGTGQTLSWITWSPLSRPSMWR